MRRSVGTMVAFVSLGVMLMSARAGSAQVLTDGADRAPRFLVASGNTVVPVDLARTPLLLRRLALDLEGLTLKQALLVISQRAGLRIMFSDDVLPLEKRVHLRAEAITVAAALTDVLSDAGVDIVLQRDGKASLVRRGPPVQRPTVVEVGVVMGQVTDAKTLQGLPGAEVILDRTQWKATTGRDGRYRLADIPAGSYTLIARRIGYQKFAAAVIVSGAEVTVDVGLTPSAINLDEVVVTGTPGGSERRTLGNAIGRVNVADNIIIAPPSKVQDLLFGAVPGVRVLRGSGDVGSGGVTRIRGSGSLSLSNEPLIYIDGVRSNNTNAQASQAYRTAFAQPSRVNDLNPEEIESIEVLKGPSAATIYGTEASNGVIQIITKRGTQGRPVFEMHGGAGTTWLMNPEGRYPTIHYIGRDGAIHGYRPLELNASRGDAPVFTTGGVYALGGNLSGGSERLRYFFSADINRDEGYLSYNWQNKYAARGNLSYSSPNAKLKLDLSLGAVRSKTRGASGVTTVTRALIAPCSLLACEPDPANPNTTGWNGLTRGYFAFLPQDYEHVFAYDNNDRTVLSLAIRHNPLPWFRHRLTVGPDFTNNFSSALVEKSPPGRIPVWFSPFGNGFKGTNAYRATLLTLDYGASADWNVSKSFVATTSAGAQYYYRLNQQINSEGSGFAVPGPGDLGGSSAVTTTEEYVENKTLGVYGQEQLAYKNRLFLTMAIRADDNSAFGANFNAAYYPKLALSWVASEESFLVNSSLISQLRFRGAWGRAGQQPDVFAAIQTYRAILERTGQSGITPTSIGNPDLKPEVGEELEVGIDAGLFKQRLGIEFTFYNKKVKDAILASPLRPSTGFPGNRLTNIGMTRNRGIELAIDGTPISSRHFGLDLRFTLATNDLRILDLGGVPPMFVGLFHIAQWNVEGFAPGSFFYKRVVNSTVQRTTVSGVQLPVGTNVMCEGGTDLGYGDGTVVPCTQAPRVYFGRPTPSWNGSLSSTISLGRRLRILGLVDYVGGLRQLSSDIHSANAVSYTSLAALQGDPVLSGYIGLRLSGDVTSSGATGLVKAGFAKLRIVSATYDLPEKVARWIGAARGSITFSGENLAILWREQKTSFGEQWIDPEMSQNFPRTDGGFVDGQLPQAARFRTAVRFTF